jgi:hypothetical protein
MTVKMKVNEERSMGELKGMWRVGMDVLSGDWSEGGERLADGAEGV